jgi:hypothetical protein
MRGAANALSVIQVNCYHLGDSAPGDWCGGCQLQTTQPYIQNLVVNTCVDVPWTPNSPAYSTIMLLTPTAIINKICSDQNCMDCKDGPSVRLQSRAGSLVRTC